MGLAIYSITPFTLLDYPGTTACIIWFAGCNMKCLYCYNPDIVTGKGKLGYDEALEFLNRRKNLLDGVVLSGGECTLHKKFPDFVAAIKKLGFKVKIDTNGSTPETMAYLAKARLVDYVALDFKAMSYSFGTITQSNLFKKFEDTLEMLIEGNIGFEVRTTVHTDLIIRHDLENMLRYLEAKGYKGNYYIQPFRNGAATLYPLNTSQLTPDHYDLETPNVKVVVRG